MSHIAAAEIGATDDGARLLKELQRLKAQSRLSFGRLAERTHYSRSSWERFLNGKRLPTREAVEQLAGVVGEDPHPLLVLLDRIGVPADGPGHTAEPAAPAPAGLGPAPYESGPGEPGPQPGRNRWRRKGSLAAAAFAGAVVGALGTGLALAGISDAAAGSASAAGTASPTAGPVRAGCSSDTCVQRDPQAMDCQWDATTAHQTWLRGMHIELRYSPACQAVWGRIENGAVGDTVTIRDRTGLQLQATIRVDHDTYTTMLAVTPEAPPDTVVVCGRIPSQKQQECSPASSLQP